MDENAYSILKVREASSDDKDTCGNDVQSVTVDLAWQNRSSTPKTPETAEVTLLRPRDEREIQWLMEKFIKTPFALYRASRVVELLERQAKKLWTELGLYEETNLLETETGKGILIEVLESQRIQKVHWELLEAISLSTGGKCKQVIVKRTIPHSGQKPNVSHTSKLQEGDKTFKILLVVARICGEFRGDNAIFIGEEGRDDIDYRLNSGPLFDIQQAFGPKFLKIDQVRPATYEAFLDALKTEKYDLVHLDMHGQVCGETAQLKFLCAEGKTTMIEAKKIAKKLGEAAVKVVSINACQSASLAGTELSSNLAKEIIYAGVPCVIGMAYKVHKDAVQIFLSAFYDAYLMRGLDPAAAVSIARASLRNNASRQTGVSGHRIQQSDFIIPKIYQRENIGSDYLCACSGLMIKRGGRDGQSIISTSIIGRNREIFELERHLVLRSNIGVVYGPRGIGKTFLLNHLEQWWVISGFVQDHVSVSYTFSDTYTDTALWETIHRQLNLEQKFDNDKERLRSEIIQHLSKRCILLTIHGAEAFPQYLFSFLKALHGTKCKVLICTDHFSGSFEDEKQEEREKWIIRLPLNGLSLSEGAALFAISSTSPETPTERDVSLINTQWRHQQQLARILQSYPLALQLVGSYASTKKQPWDVVWTVWGGVVPIQWNLPQLQELKDLFELILSKFRGLAACLVPFPSEVSMTSLASLARSRFPEELSRMNEFLQYLLRHRVAVGSGPPTASEESNSWLIHPLFIQYIRSITPADVAGCLWADASICYYNGALGWSEHGIYYPSTLDEIYDQWDNLLASLSHTLQINEDVEMILFDLPWLFTSAATSMAPQMRNQKLSDFVLESGAALTVRALQRILPKFSPRGNFVWQEIHQLYVRNQVTRMSEADTTRVLAYCIHLIDFFYEISPETARSYNEVLRWTLDGVGLQDHAEGNDELRRFCKCIYMMIDEEVTLEREPMCEIPLRQYLELLNSSDQLNLSPIRRDFLDLWVQNFGCRSRGLIPKYKEIALMVRQHLRKSKHLNNNQIVSMVQSLGDMAHASKALNESPEEAQAVLDMLQDSLCTSFEEGDNRSKFQLLEKVFAIQTTKLGDYVSGLQILDKIEDLMDEMVLLPGFRKGDRSFLDLQIWIASQRVFIARKQHMETSLPLNKLRELVNEREKSWTKEDRDREGLKNLQQACIFAVQEALESEWSTTPTVPRLFEPQDYKRLEVYQRRTEDELFSRNLQDTIQPWAADLYNELDKLSTAQYDVLAKIKTPPGIQSACFIKEARCQVHGLILDMWKPRGPGHINE